MNMGKPNRSRAEQLADHDVQFDAAGLLNGASLAWATADKQATVGAAGGATAQPATPLGYLKMKVNGVAVVIPYHNAA